MRRGGTPRPTVAAIVAAVVLCAAVVAWWLLPDASAPVAEDGDGTVERRIREVTPAAAPKIAVEKSRPETKAVPYWERPTTNGLVGCQIERWKQFHRPPSRMTNTYFITRSPEPYEIFPTRAENEIAMLLTIEPGESLVGEPDYDEDFRKEFLKSCETPIIVKDTDSPYEKQLKREMIQTKIELRNRMADGEDICEIMASSRNEAMRLGLLKDELEAETRDIIEKSAQSEGDIEDAFTALNKILENKGITPIELNPLTKRRIARQLGIRNRQYNTEENP